MDQKTFDYLLPGDDGKVYLHTFDMVQLIQVAWRVWYINAYMPQHGVSPSPQDEAFMTDILEGAYYGQD
jgi:hypothetical protein